MAPKRKPATNKEEGEAPAKKAKAGALLVGQLIAKLSDYELLREDDTPVKLGVRPARGQRPAPEAVGGSSTAKRKAPPQLRCLPCRPGTARGPTLHFFQMQATLAVGGSRMLILVLSKWPCT